MKRVLILIALLGTAQGALAEDKTVAEKAGESVERGAAATERGLKKGGEATLNGIRKAGEWIGKKVQKGGEKLEKASK